MPVKLWTYGRNKVKVSTQWLVVLRAADHNLKRKGGFILTSGARDEKGQKAQIAAKGCWSRLNPTGAACPWWTSNHVIKTLKFLIRMGRPDKYKGAAHALDVFTHDGGEQDLQDWLNSHRGVRVRGKALNTVPGEPWHLELSRASLWFLYLKYRKRWR